MKKLPKQYFIKPGFLVESVNLATDKVYFAMTPGENVTRIVKFKLVSPTVAEIMAYDTLENVKHATLFPVVQASGKFIPSEFIPHENEEKTKVTHITLDGTPFEVANQQSLSSYPVFKGLKNKIWVDGEREFKEFIREEK